MTVASFPRRAAQCKAVGHAIDVEYSSSSALFTEERTQFARRRPRQSAHTASVWPPDAAMFSGVLVQRETSMSAPSSTRI